VKRIGKYSPALNVALLLLLPTVICNAQTIAITPYDLLPERQVVVEGQNVPQWKTVWDKARELAVAGEFAEALSQYETLLALKTNLEEARWEMVRIHMYLKQWDAASGQLGFLIENDPGQSIYLVAQGRVMWELGQYERAVDLFRTVYEQNPGDQVALAGLIEGLNKLGKKEEALPLLERLSLQEPANLGVRRYLALLFYDSGNYEKARPHLVVLSGQDNVEQEILYKTAIVHEKLGRSHIAVNYWQRVLQREPGHMEAHSYLAGYYDDVGQPAETLLHLQAIQEVTPENMAVLAKIGRAYEKQGEFDKALTFYDRYLVQYPHDRDILRRVVKIHAAKGRKQQTLATLDQYYAQDKEKESKELKKQARRYDAAGRYHDAIVLYRQLVEISPDDPEILAALANDLLAIGADEGALSMWKHLSELAPDDLSVYRSMAELLERLERKDELLEVLRTLHSLDSADEWVTLQIAVLYLEKGELYESEKYFDLLRGNACRKPECLQNRALLYEKLDLEEHALHDYETLLEQLPGQYHIRTKAMELAADLGLLDRFMFHKENLITNVSPSQNMELVFLSADAHRQSGNITAAVNLYRKAIDLLPTVLDTVDKYSRDRAWLGIALSYQSGGLYYEAEQALRTALAGSENTPVFLEALVELSIAAGNPDDAGVWYEALSEELQNDSEYRAGLQPDWQMKLLKAKVFSGAGDYDSAVNLCLRLKGFFPLANVKKWVEKNDFSESRPELQIRIDLARYLIAAGEIAEAEKLTRKLVGTVGDRFELLLLLEQIHYLSGETVKAQEIGAQAMSLAEKDLGSLLTLTGLYGTLENFSRQREAAGAAVHKEPESLTAKKYLLQATINTGSLSEALQLTYWVLGKYPGNSWFRTRQIKLAARSGRYDDTLNLVNKVLDYEPERADILLLKARILWQQNLWNDSVALYKSYLSPAVDELLELQFLSQDISLDLIPQSTIWDKVTFSEGKPLSVSEVVMSPNHVVDLSGDGSSINKTAAPYYALFRWQERFKRELAVRKLVQRRYYHFAATQLESLLKDYGRDEFLLYDLAGLYSKLERPQDEAFLYAELEKQNKDFPGLQDAVQRNRLKRRPRVSVGYLMQEDDGWDGYKAIKKNAAEVTGWYSDSSSNDWSLNLQRIKYDSTNNGMDVKSLRAMLKVESKLTQAFQLKFGAGFEKLEDGHDTTPLFYAAVIGKLRDEMRTTLSFKQDVTADTITSLFRDITLREYKIDFLFDLLPRVLMGGDLQYLDYSDSNWTNKYTVWSSYLFIPEPTLLKLSYKFDYYDSKEGALSPLPPDRFGFVPNDHPYWAPIDYWITRFSFYFKHQISNDTLARGVPSYYTFEYSLGYDSDDNDLQEVKGSISMELFKHLTINASYGYSDLDVYNHEEARLSAMYRW
jgi:tetratricopeptide (TPR) repeat protein